MARIIWKEGKFVSIETRKGLYVLAQMTLDIYLVVYNVFREDENWSENDLVDLEILCFVPVVRQFLQKSVISNLKYKKEVPLELPKYWLKTDNISQKRRLYEKTEQEVEINLLGLGKYLIFNDVNDRSNFDRPIVQIVDFNDNDIIDKYEVTNIRMYAEFNERLYLCYKLGKNVDPLKDLVFNRNIPIEYEVYLKIISGKITEEEWFALPI
ncbi:hypothetical protein HX014_15765 [Myroides marinus]|uniref:hypothetical protein n=1 Tax=Myroides marinus TaxID=703342 RepID=UPI0025750B2B|nr:hypothetical protein [Myroides marinus]MDM1352060.1 hypothetical protein [Myroides marinus]MDM1359254.1 hypothetical protein [Myroides marinus]